MDGLQILPVRGMGDIEPGADLAADIIAAAPWLRDHDVLVVTSKIVSKAEGQLVNVPADGPQRQAAKEAILAAETARTVAKRGSTQIVQTHHGFVMATAGIDESNVDHHRLVLLPKDPDASARRLRLELKERFGLDVAVIVSDTMGRPWRNGLTDVALGAAGIPAIRDHRGETDPYGNELVLTQVAIIDELSSAAELVKGKCDQVPVAVVRGYLTAAVSQADGERADGAGAGAGAGTGAGAAILIRDAEHDLFSLGTAEARTAGLADAAVLTDTPFFATTRTPTAIRTQIERALAWVPLGPATVISITDTAHVDPADIDDIKIPAQTTHLLRCHARDNQVRHHVRLGQDIHRVRCAVAAEGLASAWLATDAPDGIGLLAIGLPSRQTVGVATDQ